MADLSDVKVKITQKKVIGKVGFGTPFILASMQETEIPYTLCKGIDAIKKICAEDSEIYKAAKLLFLQEECPQNVAIYASTKKAIEAIGEVFDKEWRQLIAIRTNLEEDNTIKEIADYIEAKDDKMYFCKVADLDELKALTIGQLNRTMALVYNNSTLYPEAALVGATAGLAVGSFTYKNIILKGIEAESYDELDLDAIHTNGGNCIVVKAGDIVTSEGIVTSKEYTDIVDSKDYIIKNIAYQTQKMLNINKKLPYDSRGISLLESTVNNVLKDAYNNGIIAENEDGLPLYSTTFATEETSEDERKTRKYRGGTFNFTIAGAIHNVEITGELEI